MKKIFTISCLIFALLATFQAYTQLPQKIWDKTYGGNGTQFAQSIAKTADGGYIMAGFSSSDSSANKTEDSEGGEDYWIVKINSSGEQVWDRTIGGSADDFARSVVVTIDGGCIVAGTSFSDISGSKSEDSYGLQDYWVVKLDSDGNLEWDRTIGGSSVDRATSIVALSDGGFAIAGDSKSTISGNKSEAGNGNEDFWIVKIDGTGYVIWDKSFGGDLFDYATSVTITNDSSMVVTGYSYSGISGNKTEASRGQYDYWVINVDNAGNLLWNRTIGGDDFDFALSVAKTTDGGCIVTGYTSSGLAGDKTEASKGGFDYWLVKLNSAGGIVWDRTIGGSADDFSFSVITNDNDSYLVGGSSVSGISGNKSEANKGGSDWWVLKINSAGNILWDKTIGGDMNDDLAKILPVPATNGGYLAVGTSNSSVSGDKIEANKGIKDYWLVSIDDCYNVNAPSATNQTVCYNSIASLTAVCLSGTPTWYDASGTVFLYSGVPFLTPSLIVSTAYQVRCETGGLNNCMSPFNYVNVSVYPVINNAITNTQTINTNTSITLSASCQNAIANWYSASIGGTLLGTGTYTTPVLTATTTYYVSCETGGTPNCVSNTRTPQTVNVTQTSFDSAISGNWNATSTWTCNCIPNGTLPVRIMSTHIVTVPTAYTGQAKGLRFISTGKVTLQGTGKVNVVN